LPVLATQFINWSALGKIVIAAMIGGTGVVIAFGLILLGIKRWTSANNTGARTLAFALSGLCAVFVAAAVVVGIYAMTQKPSPKRPAKKSAVVTRTTRGSS
jgi:nitrate reductase gamma subunit